MDDVVDPEVDCELQVLYVLLGQRGKRQRAAGNADALALAEQPAADDRCFGTAVVDGANRKLDPPVIQEDAIADAKCMHQLRVADLDPVLPICGEVARRARGEGGNQNDGPSAHEALKGPFDRSRPDLRSLKVSQQRHRTPHSLRRLADVRGRLAMRIRVAMREVQPRHVHSGLDHRPQDLRRRAGRSDRADDAGPPDWCHW